MMINVTPATVVVIVVVVYGCHDNMYNCSTELDNQ